MKPPVCRICGADLDEKSGGLVYFKKNQSDLAWDKKMEDEMMVGHPPYCDWFCGKHHTSAVDLSHLNIAEAAKIIREND